MDRKSKVLLIIFLMMVGISISVAFYRYIIIEDITFYTNETLFQESLLEQ